MPVTGNTDPATWNKIVSVFRGYLRAKPDPYAVFPSSGYTAAKGDSGQLIYIIQAMLDDISSSYDNAPKITVCGEYNDATEAAVRRFQQWCGIPQSGNVDSGTWNMLVHSCEHIDNMIKK